MRFLRTILKWLTLPLWIVPWVYWRLLPPEDGDPRSARARTHDYLATRKKGSEDEWR